MEDRLLVLLWRHPKLTVAEREMLQQWACAKAAGQPIYALLDHLAQQLLQRVSNPCELPLAPRHRL